MTRVPIPGVARDFCPRVGHRLQALVYDIFPSITAIADYALGLPAVFDDAQTAVNLQQTTQIILDVSFTTNHVAYASINKTKIV